MSGLDHFGLLAPYYERFIKPKPPEKLWEIAKMPTDGALLDIGGGTGRIAQFMRTKASQVVVADLSLDMLHQARDKGGLDTTCAISEQLPFRAETFDRVLMVDALHHVYDQKRTIDELWRVLKPGGRLVIEEPDLNTFAVKLVAIAEKIALMRSHFLAPNAIIALFDEHTQGARYIKDGHTAWVIVDK